MNDIDLPDDRGYLDSLPFKAFMKRVLTTITKKGTTLGELKRAHGDNKLMDALQALEGEGLIVQTRAIFPTTYKRVQPREHKKGTLSVYLPRKI